MRAWLQDLSSSSSSISEPVRRFGMSAGCRVPLSAGEGDQLRSASTRQSLSVALSRQKSIVLAQAVPTPSSSSRRQPPADPAQQTEQTPQQSKLCSRRICLLDDAMPRSLFLAPPRRRIVRRKRSHHLYTPAPPSTTAQAFESAIGSRLLHSGIFFEIGPCLSIFYCDFRARKGSNVTAQIP